MTARKDENRDDPCNLPKVDIRAGVSGDIDSDRLAVLAWSKAEIYVSGKEARSPCNYGSENALSFRDSHLPLPRARYEY